MSADVSRCLPMSADVSRCQPMSVDVMSADVVTRRCDAMLIAGQTSMPDDAIYFHVVRTAMAGDGDAEQK